MDKFAIKKYRKYFKIINVFIFVFCILNFRIDGDVSFIISETLFVIYINLIFFILSSSIFNYLYEPPVFFLIFDFIYEFLKFPFYFGYNTPENFVSFSGLLNSRHRVTDYYGSAALMLLYDILCVSTLLIVYLTFRKQHQKIDFRFPTYKFINAGVIVLVVVLAGIFSAIFLYKITGGNFLYLLSRRSGNSDALKLLKDNFLLSLFSNLILVLIPLYLSTKLLDGSKNWKRVLWLYLPATILSFLITGARGFTIFSIGTTLILIFSFKKVPIRFFLPFIPILFVVFAVLGLLRRSSNTNKGKLSDNIEAQQALNNSWYYELASYQLQLRDELVFSNLQSSDLLFGQSYLNLIFFPIPRDWIGDSKPQFTDAYVAETFWGRTDIGLPLNSMTESYFNFSYFGILVFVVMGSIMATITNSLTRSGNLMRQSLMIILMVYAQTWATTEIVYIFQFLFFIIPLMAMISEKKYMQQSKYSV
jgi:oligosaccharide repeat unit polymerase